MIQEVLGGERKLSFHGAVLGGITSSTPSPSPCGSTTTTTNNNTITTTTTSAEHLRCPRCDSANTKFCYYNNYNLTQPRHFCKTCRRYWTKGGALRNVPIGGGCRKTRNTIVSATAGKSTTGKTKTVSSDIVKSSLGSGFDTEQSSHPILWGSPQNSQSQLLALLRATPNNPSPNFSSIPNFVNSKDEGHMIESNVSLESAVMTGALNARAVGLDSLGQVPIGLYNSISRNNIQHQPQLLLNQHHHHHQQQNLSQGDAQNTGIQELYQRLRSSVNYYPDQSSLTTSNLTSMPASSSSIMEPTAIAGGEFNCWNPQFSWSSVQAATNGAFP